MENSCIFIVSGCHTLVHTYMFMHCGKVSVLTYRGALSPIHTYTYYANGIVYNWCTADLRIPRPSGSCVHTLRIQLVYAHYTADVQVHTVFAYVGIAFSAWSYSTNSLYRCPCFRGTQKFAIWTTETVLSREMSLSFMRV